VRKSPSVSVLRSFDDPSMNSGQDRLLRQPFDPSMNSGQVASTALRQAQDSTGQAPLRQAQGRSRTGHDPVGIEGKLQLIVGCRLIGIDRAGKVLVRVDDRDFENPTEVLWRARRSSRACFEFEC